MRLTLLFLFFAFMGITFTFGAETFAQKSNQSTGQPQRMKDFYLSNYKENGTRDWEIKGNEAKIDGQYVDIDKMEAKYYSKNDVMSVKSDKAKLDRDSMNASLKDNVEVKIPMEGSKDYTTITCDGPLEMEYTKGNAVFYNKVVVTNPDGKLYCDKASVFFDNTAKKIQRIVAEGNVKILKDDNVTFSQKATYYAQEQRVVLEGSPRIVYFPKESGAPK
ncbi:MAG: LptA/OstA family protein [Candidatus Omnitrophica bacterium]|nr:LptA/OstA family protein [Candidatus Omnitrophota bacterium]